VAQFSVLAEALRDRYVLERELGRGGMATVWLARDLKHERPVALKVLRPDLGAVLGADRFLREIRLTAGLHHPHILPLLDSGEAAGQLWFTMPYVEGETLRACIRRERQLPLEDALRIVREVADALTHAHAHGIVHRDIKPENILLEGGHALVADFGIARALGESPGELEAGTALTATGMSIGTPAYMSPEQATGDKAIDARTDVYALGCVLYEMLVGEPPHAGPTAQAILARRLIEPVPPVRRVREQVPHSVDAAIRTAVARSPADRFPTCAEFAAALNASPSTVAISRTSGSTPRRVRLALTAAVLAIALAAGSLLRSRDPVSVAVADEVAVFPFRVAGADPALHYLREGMVDLLAAKLTGEGGPRATDPRAVVRAWRQAGGAPDADPTEAAMVEAGNRLKARRIVVGSVVGTPARVALQARMLAGEASPPTATAEGPADSLPLLVDRLTAQLLARGARQAEQRLADLTSTSLPALRAYLDGQAAFRSGRYAAAMAAFNRALELDSTFALAALGVLSTDLWLGTTNPRARAIAWAGRERLSPRDRVLADAYLGPHYPELPWIKEDLTGWLRAIEFASDRAEAWFFAGDRFFHWGSMLEYPDADARAEAYFRRALELDPGWEAPISHLAELAAIRGDTAEAASFAAQFLAADSAGDAAGYVRWRLAAARKDSTSLDALRREFARMPSGSLLRIIHTTQEEGIELADADRAAAVLLNRAGPTAERRQILESLLSLALHRGRPGLHTELSEKLHRLDPGSRAYLHLRVSGAFYADGDTAVAARAAEALSAAAYASSSADSSQRAERLNDLCWLGLWRVRERRLASADSALEALRRGGDTGCEALLAAHLYAARGSSTSAEATRRLDSLARSGAQITLGVNLSAATLNESNRDYAKALAAVRRRGRWPLMPYTYMSTFVREEGRLAALTGDTAGAIRAYRHYLALRSDPEPSRRADADSARAALQRLTGEPALP
jgi:eukaryotic-like serine/threonine-protein kinase